MPAPSSDFDPYHKWLAIPKNIKRPPHYYALLGISLDEEDPEVITAATEQRLKFVESQAGTGHDIVLQEIVSQLKEAELTLLNLSMRESYDRRLNLYQSRSKQRKVNDKSVNVHIKSRRGKSVGEESSNLRSFGIYCGIFAVVFTILSLFAYPTLRKAVVQKPPLIIKASQAEENPLAAAEQDKVLIETKAEQHQADDVAVASPDTKTDPIQTPMSSPELVPVKMEILNTDTATSDSSSLDYAVFDGNRFEVGIGDDPKGMGYGCVGFLISNLESIEVDTEFYGTPQTKDENTFVGGIVDYRVNGQFTKRIAFTPTVKMPRRTDPIPTWGTATIPVFTEPVFSEKYIGDDTRGFFTVNIEKFAPADWDGVVWLSILVQNSGRNSGAKGSVMMIPRKKMIPLVNSTNASPTPSATSLPVDRQLSIASREQRALGRWVIHRGGKIVTAPLNLSSSQQIVPPRISLDELKDNMVDSPTNIPTTDFAVVAIIFHDVKNIGNDDLIKLSTGKYLQHLWLSGTSVNTSGMKSLEHLQELESLFLGGVQVQDEGMRSIGKLSKLQTLGLHATKVTNQGLTYLTTLKDLTSVRISQTSMTPAAVKRNLPWCHKISE